MIKEYVIQVIQNAIAYHLQTSAQLVSEQGQPAWPTPPWVTCHVQHDNRIWYGIWPGISGLFMSAVLILSSPRFSCIPSSSLAEHCEWKVEKSLSYYNHCTATYKTLVCYQCHSHPKSKTHHQIPWRKLTVFQTKQGQQIRIQKTELFMEVRKLKQFCSWIRRE